MPANDKSKSNKKGSSSSVKKFTNRKGSVPVSRVKNDACGVALVALGVFLCLSLFIDGIGWLGEGLRSLMFGVLGIGYYAMPFVVFSIGLYMLLSQEPSMNMKKGLLVFGLFVAVLSLIHLFICPFLSEIKVFEYYKKAYVDGQSHTGGGVTGALLTYPITLLIGNAGAIVFFVAAILIMLIVLTKFSIKDAAARMERRRRFEAYDAKESTNRRKASAVSSIEEDLLEGAARRAALSKKEADDKTEKDAENAKSSGKTLAEEMRVRKKNKTKDIDVLPDSGPFETAGKKANEAEKADTAPITDDYEEQDIIIEGYASEAAPSKNVENTSGEADENSIEAVAAGVPTEIAEYQFPPRSILKVSTEQPQRPMASNEAKAKKLLDTLASFNIEARIINVSQGPVITRFELQPAQGIRVSRITSLADDIALALAAPRVRIEAPIPGKAAIGVEVPNTNTAMVLLGDVIKERDFDKSKSPASLALGKDIAGAPLIAEIDKMPHLLIAGQTGAGKSVCINSIIISMVYKATPAELRMILIDPKVVELSVFSTLPHLMMPVVTDPKKAAGALKWAVHEMEQRYNKMAKIGARDLARYNAMQENDEDKLPKLIIIVDELADLMMVAAKDVEDAICRIAQLGRACGIHLIVATQSPRTDVITGLIKANIPSRIAFAVSSGIDSRVILDSMGAEKLLGKGDMLFHANGAGKPVRAQGAYVSDEEVEEITDFFIKHSIAQTQDVKTIDEIISTAKPQTVQGGGKQEDELLPEAVSICIETGVASISLIQRKLRVGYARAARLVDIMEEKKYVSGFEGSKARKVLITKAEYEQEFGTNAAIGGSDDE